MIIIGIDPGIVNTGYCIFDSDNNTVIKSGEIVANQSNDVDKLVYIYQQYKQLLDDYNPYMLVYEAPVFLGRGNNGERLNRAIGVIELTSRLHNIDSIFSYSPKHIKLTITGNGKADKLTVAKSVNDYLGTNIAFSSSHATDAIAIVITHLMELK